MTAQAQSDPGSSARARVAWRLLPFLFLLYVLNYLDRTNIAYAALGMKGDLRLTDSVFGTASGIFFLGYLGLQIPCALLVERWSARRVLALTLMAWGALTALTGFVRTPLQLYGARFLLGAAEAGFFPGVIVYLSHWFILPDRARAVARFMAAVPMAYIVSGPLAGAILQVDWLGIAGWRWLFLLEGVPAILGGIATFFFLPDRPRQAGWLQPNERDWLVARLVKERGGGADLNQVTIGQALRQPAVLFLTAGLFFSYSGGYAFWFWFPTMLQRLTGWSDLQRIGWVGVLPSLAALIGMLLVGWSSDRTRERRWHFAIPQFIAVLALVAWFLFPHSNAFLFVVFSLVGFGTTAHLPSFWVLPSSFLSSSAVAAAVGLINCIASIGGFVGPKIFGDLSQRSAGSFRHGLIMMIACLTIASVLVLFCPREQTGEKSCS